MNKNVLITGASRGIGRAIAESFAKNGWNLFIVSSKNEKKLKDTAKYLNETYNISCVTFLGDVSKPDTVRAIYDSFKENYSTLDVVVNNAGVSKIDLFTSLSDEDWSRICGVNLNGTLFSCREAAKIMIEQKHGKIFNISSMWGQVGASCEVAYSATKGAVDSLTKALAKELAPSNIQVNAVSPGVIDTEMNSCLSEEEKSDLCEDIPAGRFGEPSEVGDLIVKLSDGPDYLTGQIIRIDGGMV